MNEVQQGMGRSNRGRYWKFWQGIFFIDATSLKFGDMIANTDTFLDTGVFNTIIIIIIIILMN